MARRPQKDTIEVQDNGNLREGRFRSAAAEFEAKAQRRSGDVATRYDVRREKQTLLGSVFGLKPKVIQETFDNADEIRGDRYRGADITAQAVDTRTGRMVGQGQATRAASDRAVFEVEREARWYESLFDMFKRDDKVMERAETKAPVANEPDDPWQRLEPQEKSISVPSASEEIADPVSHKDYSQELNGLMRGEFNETAPKGDEGENRPMSLVLVFDAGAMPQAQENHSEITPQHAAPQTAVAA